MSSLKINVLGTDYSVAIKTEEEDKSLLTTNGNIDTTVKKITVREIKQEEDSLEDLTKFSKYVLKHEMIHAFLYESGLNIGVSNVHTEETVDWIASQLDKMYQSYKKVEKNFERECEKIYGKKM